MAKIFDSALRGLFGKHSEDWLKYLGVSPPGTPIQSLDSDISSVTAQADKVFRIQTPVPFIAHFEFQSNYKPELIPRLLRYNAILHELHRVPVATLLLLPRPEADGPAYSGSLEYETGKLNSGVSFRYHVVRVWEMKSSDLLKGGPGMVALAPLADDAANSLDRVIAEVWKKLSKEGDASSLLRTTSLLMGLRYTDERIEQAVEGAHKMTTMEEIYNESSTIKLFKRKWMEQARVEESRNSLIAIGTKLFGSPTSTQRKQLARIKDLELLRKLELRAIDAGSWKELLTSSK